MPNLEFYRRKIDKLFAHWDACLDPYSEPLEEFQRLTRIVNEAVAMSMVLNAAERELRQKDKMISHLEGLLAQRQETITKLKNKS